MKMQLEYVFIVNTVRSPNTIKVTNNNAKEAIGL